MKGSWGASVGWRDGGDGGDGSRLLVGPGTFVRLGGRREGHALRPPAVLLPGDRWRGAAGLPRQVRGWGGRDSGVNSAPHGRVVYVRLTAVRCLEQCVR